MRRLDRAPGGLVALTAVALALLGCGGDRGQPRGEMTLTWQDEFDGPEGQPPDTSRWRYDIGTDWGNAQLEFDTDRTQNVSLDGEGHLRITARREDYQGREYTSGRINTYRKFAQTRGRFEARIHLPEGAGIWPAFWLLGANFEDVGWPQCGEIDIMEYRGQEPDILHGSLHGPGYSAGHAVTGSTRLPEGGFPDGFHVFGVEWSEDAITWTLDGEAYRTVTTADLPGGAAWVFDHPFFVILNVAVGGHFVGPPDANTTFPQTMRVDWVRVWSAP